MRSRLHEMCEFVVMDAADYRERPDNAGSEDLLAMWKMRKKGTLPSPRSGRQARAQIRDGKEREVVRLRFGLEDDEPRTLQEIGDRLHLSRERVRQIETRAKDKLRRSAKLRSHLN